MKAVPKVNKDGLYIEDTLVDDAFNGVVPFYAEEQLEHLEEEEEQEREIVGHIVGVPVPSGLYLPRFDIVAWEAKEDDGYYLTTTYWGEGLSPDEIDELTKAQPQEPNEMEQLAVVVEGIQQQNSQLLEAVDSSREELFEMKTASAEQQQTLSALGSEQVKQDLSTIDLKQQNNIIGAELVRKDISILDLYMQGQVLGQMLAALELKLLANGTGGESNVQQ